MFKQVIIQRIVLLILILVCATGWGSRNATTMEYRSAKTAARSERNLNRAEEWGLKALAMEEHANDASVAFFLATEVYKPRKNWSEMNNMLNRALEINPEQKLKGFSALKSRKKEIVKDAVAMYKEELWVNVFNSAFSMYERGKLDKAIEQFSLAKNILDKIENYLALADLYSQMENPEKTIENLIKAEEMEPNNFDVLIALGLYSYNNSDYEKSTQYYSKAFDNAKDKDIARKTLVDMALMNKELNNNIINQKIKNEIDIILKAEPNNYKNLQIAGECYTILEDYTTAMNYYNQAIDLIDDEVQKNQVLKKMLEMNINAKMYEDAIAIKEQLEFVYYNDANFMYIVGVLYQNLAANLYDESNEALNKYRTHSGDDEELITIYQNFMESLEFAEQAIESFETTESLSSGYIDNQISDLESLIEWINTNTMSIEEQAIEKGIEDLLFD